MGVRMMNAAEDVVEVELDLELLIDNDSYEDCRTGDKGEALWQCSEECSDGSSGSGRRMCRAATDG